MTSDTEDRTSASHRRRSDGLADARPPSLPAAVLWDMDGTLVDTEPFWIAAQHRLARAHGAAWSQEHALNLVGSDLLDSGHYIREHMGLDLEPAQIVEELLDDVVMHVQESVPWRPGAVELLEALHAEGIPGGLVTMSYQRFVDPILAGLGYNPFDVVVTGDVVGRGKPHPEPYLTAARLLGVAPEDCLAIEDSEPGTTSAVAAGCTTLVVPLHVQVSPGERRILRDTLVGVDLETLRAWMTLAPGATRETR